MIDLVDLYRAVLDTVRDATGFAFEVNEAPAGAGAAPRENEPWGIVYPILGGVFWGTNAEPEDSVSAVVQITSVGRKWDQAAWLGDRVRTVMLDRRADGRFSTPMPWPGQRSGSPARIIDRRTEGAPGIDAPGPETVEVLPSVPERFLIVAVPV